MSPDESRKPSSRPPRQHAAPPVRYVVSELLMGGSEAILEHDGSEYHLRITANGRLILTK